MDSDNDFSMPTLGLVGSSGNVEKPGKEEESGAPYLVAVSSMKTPDNSVEVEEEVKQVTSDDENNVSNKTVDINNVVPPGLTTMLLIFKRDLEESNDYMIANPPAEEEYQDEYYERRRRKKKKKKDKKSKEGVLSMSRAGAENLLGYQKSLKKLTTRYQADLTEKSPSEDRDRRRRTQSASCFPGNDSSFSGLKSPPLSAPILGQLPSFTGFKGKTNLYRRRQLSTGSAIAENKRRFTRKKRWESEETRSSGIATPTIETARKNHLSENNVWTPTDDYRLLVNGVQTKGNLEHVFAGTKFSCFYTFEDVEHRWETLLYDAKAGPLSQQAISNLHPFVKAKIQSEALFSEDEENLLRTIQILPGGAVPDQGVFITLLEDNPEVFPHRTTHQLQMHWMDMKTFHLLEGQDVRDYKDPFNLYEFQDSAYLASIPDTSIISELQTESRLVKRQIRQLEEEIESWRCMQELVVSDGTTDLQSIFSVSEFDDQTYAILRGKQVRYCMRSKEILLGRHSTNNKVDADLTLEGASGKVSRRQAIIQMRGFGDFYIINQGRHSIFVDSQHVPYGAMAKLSDGCVIQITHINLIFKINDKLMRKEVNHEISKELMNARLKSYDSISSPSFTSVTKPAGLNDPFIPPASPKYKSPRKRSISSTNSSPGAGLPRPIGSSPITLSSVNLPSPIIPFSSGDLTIRAGFQPQSPSSYLPENNKGQLSRSFSNDSDDVFKKPAPVTSNRSSSSKNSSPARILSTPLSSADSVASSAFATVGNAQMLPNANIYQDKSQKGSVLSEASHQNVSKAEGQQQTQSATLTLASNFIDYANYGLSSDVTVTQRLTPSDAPSTEETSKSSSSFVDDLNDEPPMPILGLVKVEPDSPTKAPTIIP